MQNESDQLKPHEYDGIKEYDNNLPRWWIGTFILTVVFGFGYWLYYHVYGIGASNYKEWAKDKAIYQKQYESVLNQKDIGPSDDAIKALLAQKNVMQEAKQIFDQNCAVCHGVEGQGVIGPNLTDEYWLHGGTPAQIYHTIENGVVEKGMLSWKGTLSPDQIKKIAAYVILLKGSNPPNPKAPQGDKVVD